MAKLQCTEADYHAMERDGEGMCTSLDCLDINPGEGGYCEPDAENYTCTECGRKTLTGPHWLLMAGNVVFDD